MFPNSLHHSGIEWTFMLPQNPRSAGCGRLGCHNVVFDRDFLISIGNLSCSESSLSQIDLCILVSMVQMQRSYPKPFSQMNAFRVPYWGGF